MMEEKKKVYELLDEKGYAITRLKCTEKEMEFWKAEFEASGIVEWDEDERT